MGFADISIIHHSAIVFLLLWMLDSIGWCNPFTIFICFLYLYKVNERYSLKLKKKLQFQERRSATRGRLHVDSESVRWLNNVVNRVWPICMEQIASQQFLLPIIPWFLDKYKPWTARTVSVQQLYMGRTPPTFTEIRAVREPHDDDHLLLELGMNFLSAEDMIAVLEIQLRKRVGLGIRAKMNITGMHLEGKVLVGLRFTDQWPYIDRARVCFVEPPYFQMTVKPIFHHGVDVTEVPGIAGWLDKLMAIAFEQTLVEPNMLVVDMKKFASSEKENWFTVDEKLPIAFAKVEIIEAVDLKAADMNGFSDPYVKGQLGPYRFSTKIQKKTLTPKWQEEFRIPISSWEAPNLLNIQVCDKDIISSDKLGNCVIDVNTFRGGQRQEKWITLENIDRGKLLLAITIEETQKVQESNKGKCAGEDEDYNTTSSSTESSLRGEKTTDHGEDIKYNYEKSREEVFFSSPESVDSSNIDNDPNRKSKGEGRNIVSKGLHKISKKLNKESKNNEYKMHGKEETAFKAAYDVR